MEERVYSGSQFQRESMKARKVGSRSKKAKRSHFDPHKGRKEKE